MESPTAGHPSPKEDRNVILPLVDRRIRVRLLRVRVVRWTRVECRRPPSDMGPALPLSILYGTEGCERRGSSWGRRHKAWAAAHDEAIESSESNLPGEKPYWLNLRDDPARADALKHGWAFRFDTAAELIEHAQHLESLGFQGPSYGMDDY